MCLCVVLLDARPPHRGPAFLLANAKNSMQQPFKKTVKDSVMLNHLNKRAAMSFNNDLHSLAALMQESSNRRRLEAAQSFLRAIGKRSAEIAPRVDTYISKPDVRNQSPQNLSVGVSLEAIHDMIRAQRRRQSVGRAMNAYDRLQIIGKRSAEHLLNDLDNGEVGIL